MKRRDWMQVALKAGTSSLLCLAGLSAFYHLQARDPDPWRPEGEPEVLRPPGAVGEREFLARCIRCQRCQDACPKGCIRLAGPMDRTHRGTPFIAASENACDLCLECTRACPTGALLPVAAKEQVRMGTARVDERTCVSHNRTGVCGACFTACPLRGRAITQNLRNAPVVHADFCAGCGLCEEACILKGVKAIRVFSGRAA
jgi:ferredoxin-type protein NapG/ferredoxin-type protein NapH